MTVVDVDVCPRCNERHLHLTFTLLEEFSGTHNACEDSITLTHWATCPRTGQPLLSGTNDTYPEIIYL